MSPQNPYKILRIAYVCFAVVIFSVYILIQRREKSSIRSLTLDVWYTEKEKVHRPPHFNRDHGFCGPCPKDKQVSRAWQLVDLISLISPNVSFLVNIGAASAFGGIYDPTYPLLTSINFSFSALLIDPNPDPSLFYAYPNRSNVRIINDYIWTESIIENIFQKYSVPKEFVLLKVDIDSYECALLEKILSSNYRPQIIHTEFNPIFAPPVNFMPIYNSTTKIDWKPPLWANNGPFYGCSLSALSNIMRSYDYVLVDVDFWDVMFMQRPLAVMHRIQVPVNDEVAYEHGFLKHACTPYCWGNLKLHNNHIENAIKVGMNQSNFTTYIKPIIDAFAPLSVKTKERHPYIISL